METEGLTGEIRFNESGKRINYTIHVVEMNVNRVLVKIADWSDTKGLTPIKLEQIHGQLAAQRRMDEYEKNYTYIVTTIIEEPYVMYKPDFQKYEGNDRFEGFCKDLADLIAQKLGINCKYRRHDVNKFACKSTLLLQKFSVVVSWLGRGNGARHTQYSESSYFPCHQTDDINQRGFCRNKFIVF